MSPGQHAADDGSFSRSASGAMIRGVVLIVVAVALGVILLQATDGPDPFTSSTGVGGPARKTTTTVAGGAASPTTTTASTVPGVDPSTITVLVANGAGVSGLAGKLTDQVKAEGFQTADPTDTKKIEKSTVYFTPGFEQAAPAVAALFDPPPAVAPLPDPSPVEDLQGANVVLVAAADLAEQ